MVKTSCLELKKIKFFYKKNILVLDDLNVKFYSGEITALLGINGSGKTTLFKILTGIYKPKEGLLIYNDKIINKSNILYYKSLLGFMPEFLQLYKNMLVKDVLKLLGSLKGYDNFDVKNILDIVFLSEHADKKIKTLSKGMKQRLNLGQAIIGEPKIILFDEPSNGFDCGSIAMFYSVLKNISSKGSVVLLSSHHLTEVYGNVDKVIILSGGKIVKELYVDFFNCESKFLYKYIWVAIQGKINNELLMFLKNHSFSIKRNVLYGKVNNYLFVNLLTRIFNCDLEIRDIKIEDKMLEHTLLELS